MLNLRVVNKDQKQNKLNSDSAYTYMLQVLCLCWPVLVFCYTLVIKYECHAHIFIFVGASLRLLTGKIRMCEELIAHLSAKASPKAKEFSKKIGSKLQFKLFPRSDLYPKIFQDACPDRDDIALYFYPTNVERSRKHYSRLVKDMELKDLMMWTQIDGRELLVYPSTILTPDSQKLENSYFMWGVFGRRKYEFNFW